MTGDPDGVCVPGRARPRARLLVLGAQDGAAVRGARPRRGRDRAEARRTSRRRTSARSCGRSSGASGGASARPALARIAVVGGVAANSELRAALPDARVRAARALHRQRRDDRLVRTVRRAASVPSLPWRSMRTRLSRSLVGTGGGRPGAPLRRQAVLARRSSPRRPSTRQAGRACSACARPSRPRSATSFSSKPPSLAARVHGERRRGDGEGDARVDGCRRRAAGAVPRPTGGRGRADRARVPVRAGWSTASRPRSTRRRWRCSSATARSSACTRCASPIRRRRTRRERGAAVGGRGSRDRGSRRHRRHRRAARHGCRSVPSRTCAGSVLSGVDVINPGSGGIAQPHPTIPGRPERHATELAGIIAGIRGPGRAPRDRARRLDPARPRRAAGSPNAEGGYSVYSRTDQILAGLEAAVDPNDDGDAHDAARIALDRDGRAVRRRSPTARSRERSPERPTSTRSRSSRPVTTVRQGLGTGASPDPAVLPTAVTVAAADGRLAAPTVRVHVRAGLRVLFEDAVPLGGAPSDTVTADVVLRESPHGGEGDRRALLDGRRQRGRGSGRAPSAWRALRRHRGGGDLGGALSLFSSTGRCRPARSASTFRRAFRSSVSTERFVREIRAMIAAGDPRNGGDRRRRGRRARRPVDRSRRSRRAGSRSTARSSPISRRQASPCRRPSPVAATRARCGSGR